MHWEEVAKAVAACCYPPVVMRSSGPVRAVDIGLSDLSFALGLVPRSDHPAPVPIATCDKSRAAAHKVQAQCWQPEQ